MVFSCIEKVFCVGSCSKNSKKTVQRVFMKDFSKKSPTTMQSLPWQKNSRTKADCVASCLGGARVPTGRVPRHMRCVH